MVTKINKLKYKFSTLLTISGFQGTSFYPNSKAMWQEGSVVNLTPDLWTATFNNTFPIFLLLALATDVSYTELGHLTKKLQKIFLKINFCCSDEQYERPQTASISGANVPILR